jgi:histidinol phosphatase-like PHP family hydrolase
MYAFDELATRCEQRGWRLAITGDAHEPHGSVVKLNRPAMIVDGHEVR